MTEVRQEHREVAERIAKPWVAGWPRQGAELVDAIATALTAAEEVAREREREADALIAEASPVSVWKDGDPDNVAFGPEHNLMITRIRQSIAAAIRARRP